MKKIALLLIGVLLLPHFSRTSSAQELPLEGLMETPLEFGLENSVVQIIVTVNPPDYFRPWTTMGTGVNTGSGAIIEGEQILTSAHVVSDATFIEVKKHGDPRSYSAEIKAIGHDCDLALLSVEDTGFFKETRPIPLGDLPSLQDQVTVIGYPVGGTRLSITKGIVSRIETTPYAHSFEELLAIQIDAAINPGSSGGPVIQDGKLIGVAFQGLIPAQNIGYVIPTPIIRHFFEDLEDGVYDGFPSMGVMTQPMQNMFLREYHGLEDDQGGVMVTAVMPESRAGRHLKENDIILEAEGVPIGQDGTVHLEGSHQVSFRHLISLKQIGEEVSLKLLRRGKEKEVSFPLDPFVRLVPSPHHFDEPVYYIYGGLVFSVLSMDLLKRGFLTGNIAPLMNLYYYAAGPGMFFPEERSEITLLLDVLPDSANAGYHFLMLQVVDTVNGRKVRSFEDLVRALHHAADQYVTITTEDKAEILLDTSGMEEINQRILQRYNIPSQYSSLVASWVEE